MPIIFIAHRLAEPKTGGEICNKMITSAAIGDTFEVWESKDIPHKGLLSRLPFSGRIVANLHFSRKAFNIPTGSIILFDTDFSQYLFFAIWVLKYLRSARIVAICHHLRSSVGGVGIKGRFTRFFEKATARSTGFLITVSAFSLKSFLDLGAKPAKQWIISPPIASPPAFRESVAASDNRIRFLTVATLEKRKNYLGMIWAISRMDFPFVWRIAGSPQDGQLHAEMAQLVSELALDDKIEILGRVSEDALRELYAHSDIFYMVSFIEGFGIVYGEAMSYGMPIIASRTGATPELVTDGVNGLLCDPESIDDMAAKIRLVCGEKALRERMRLSNLEKSRSFQTTQGFIEQAGRALQEIISAESPKAKVAAG